MAALSHQTRVQHPLLHQHNLEQSRVELEACRAELAEQLQQEPTQEYADEEEGVGREFDGSGPPSSSNVAQGQGAAADAIAHPTSHIL